MPCGDRVWCLKDEAGSGSKEERPKGRGALTAPLVLAVPEARSGRVFIEQHFVRRWPAKSSAPAALVTGKVGRGSPRGRTFLLVLSSSEEQARRARHPLA